MHCIDVNEPTERTALRSPGAAGSACIEADAHPIETVVLCNRNGLRADVANLGAALLAMWVPDRDGQLANVVLGHADMQQRAATRDFMGVSVGRVAGRISGARFALDRHEYSIDTDTPGISLHGGPQGFDTRTWRWLEVDEHRARLHMVSADGDQGFPGTVTIKVEYRITDDALHVEYSATSDRTTVINLTHHPFWNLAGEGAGRIDDHRLSVPASTFAVLDERLLPTGELRSVRDTPFDFRAPRDLGAGLRDASDAQLRAANGYDHYWVLDASEIVDELRVAARLSDPSSGRTLEIRTNQPGLQIYSGNFLDGRVTGPAGRAYNAHDGLCLEPQAYPDAVNRPEFPSVRLEPGHIYRNRIVYRFGCIEANTAADSHAHASQGNA